MRPLFQGFRLGGRPLQAPAPCLHLMPTTNPQAPLLLSLGISATEASRDCCIFLLTPSGTEALHVKDKFRQVGWLYRCSLAGHPQPRGVLRVWGSSQRERDANTTAWTRWSRAQPFPGTPLCIPDPEGGHAWDGFSLRHKRTSEAPIPSVSSISTWQGVLWCARNIYHWRRETQKCIISAASILPDHFTQTPGREKHYFTVRTLNVVHTFGSFFFFYMVTAYLEVSHLEQPPRRGLRSGDFWPITVNWDKSQAQEKGLWAPPQPHHQWSASCRRWRGGSPLAKELVHPNMVSWPNFLSKNWNHISRFRIIKSLDEDWQKVQGRRRQSKDLPIPKWESGELASKPMTSEKLWEVGLLLHPSPKLPALPLKSLDPDPPTNLVTGKPRRQAKLRTPKGGLLA